ncbi:hypothetical protein [Lactococcus protaetiae]|uniref:Uncharacterized protein n=1 Tax=Lactococcus protaetiae TaxID=2592653 RepID=A0A514Z6H6_9LACT|nr:hypothetical protein [Lactococcus protaetiae]QDK70153.1 hypothetical protein FLP15_01890 [Lactococcus protaetiae]
MKKTLIKEVDKFTPVILVLLFFMFCFVLNGLITSNNLKVKHRAQAESFVVNRKISVSVDFEGAYFKPGSTLNKMSISFSPMDLLLMNRDNLALAKFIVLQGLDNRFQVITFIKFIGENKHGTEDALIYFDGLEVYSASTWNKKINAHGWNEKTREKLSAIYEKTSHEYSELCNFVQKNVVA